MRILLGSLLVWVLFHGNATAQPVTGYAGAGPGIYTNDATSGGLLHVGGGADVAVNRFLAFGSDVGLLLGSGDAALPIAFNASAHVGAGGAFDPFVRGGFTRVAYLTEPGGVNAAHIGGGFNYWFAPNRGWIVEVRVIRPRFIGQYWVARFGVAFK